MIRTGVARDPRLDPDPRRRGGGDEAGEGCRKGKGRGRRGERNTTERRRKRTEGEEKWAGRKINRGRLTDGEGTMGKEGEGREGKGAEGERLDGGVGKF